MNTYLGRLAPMLVAPTLLLALTGCSGDDEASESKESATDSPTAAETSKPPTTSPKLPTVPRVAGARGGVADVEWDPSTCKTTAGKQSVSGTVTNPGSRATDYVITISWTNATSDTLGLGFATVEAAKSKTETDWELSATVPEGATQCVINVVRGDVRA